MENITTFLFESYFLNSYCACYLKDNGSDKFIPFYLCQIITEKSDIILDCSNKRLFEKAKNLNMIFDNKIYIKVISCGVFPVKFFDMEDKIKKYMLESVPGVILNNDMFVFFDTERIF